MLKIYFLLFIYVKIKKKILKLFKINNFINTRTLKKNIKIKFSKYDL